MKLDKIHGTPALYRYLKKYQEDPRSRIFAPLAEAYRKAGLINEAIDIARDGVRIHPQFVGGRVALARALFDKRLYPEVVQELESVVQDSPDNLIAQRMLGECYLILGRSAHALLTYKTILFLVPSDPEVAKLVEELETKAYQQGAALWVSEGKDFLVTEPGHEIPTSPDHQRKKWIAKIEMLQMMLMKVQRFKLAKSV